MIRTKSEQDQIAPAKPPSAHVCDQAAAAIPAELRAKPRWLVWRWHLDKGKWKKPPIDPLTGGHLTDWTNPKNCLTFEEARQLSREIGDGIGFLLGDDLVIIDWDDCFDANGNLDPRVKRQVDALNSYTEVTPRGKGLHTAVHGRKPGTRCKNDHIEMYDGNGRFLTFTGNHLAGTPTTIEHRQQALDNLYSKAFGDVPTIPTGGGDGSPPPLPVDLSDEELLNRARAARNGAEFKALFDDGTITHFTPAGKPDRSKTHLDLMGRLAWWTNRDPARMERLFGKSAFRDDAKWQRAGYRESTIKEAIAKCQGGYAPKIPASSKPSRNGHAKPPWATKPILGTKGQPLSCLRNSVLWLEEHVDAIRFDGFHQTITVGGELFSEEMAIELQHRIETAIGSPWNLDPVRNAVTLIAHRNAFNSLTAWLDALKWDHVPRIGDFFADTFNVAKDEYAAFVSSVFFLGAVARAYEPGCKVDTMPVLIGAQGILKSSTFRALVPDERLFTDDLGADLFDKKPGEGLRGKWIVEFSEFARINRSTIDVVKSFLSRQFDHYRPPYGRYFKDFPRTCVFVGTTNNPEPLHDDENRRFLPLVCGESQNPIGYARGNRDQLWAEAVHRYRQGEHWWTDDAKVLEAAREAQDRARAPDLWEEILAENLRTRSTVTLREAAELLRLPIDRCDKSAQTRIGLIIRKLGFTGKTRPYDEDGARVYTWIRP